MTTSLEKPELDWSGGHPVSGRFADVYYSAENGLAESRHVFLEQNHLPERWQSLEAGAAFCIGETGFGTGLNFLCAVQLWLQSAPVNSRLHYVSVEKFPLCREELALAHQQWPELVSLSEQLLGGYPPPVAGVHRCWLYDDRVCLTLLFGDGQRCLEATAGSDHPLFAERGNPAADAWFLDGFAPAKNPDLWTGALFGLLARLSHEGTTLATFTAAGLVRRGLEDAGFAMEKVPGFGRKRHMLRGTMASDHRLPSAVDAGMQDVNFGIRNGDWSPPWYLNGRTPPDPEKSAVVIGGGIAGCSTARSLARRGWQVTLVDSQTDLASGASGNPQGIVYPKLSVESSPLSAFGLAALCHAMTWYRPFWPQGASVEPGGVPAGEPCGVLVLPETDRDRQAFERIGQRYQAAPELVRLLDRQQMEQIAGLPLASRLGLYFPALGWVNPGQVCRQLAGHPGIQRLTDHIADLEFDPECDNWQLLGSDRRLITSAPVVVIACGNGSNRFGQTGYLPLKAIRGQITSMPATPDSRVLKTVICGHGYLAPARDGAHTLGASYNPGVESLALNPEDHRSNLAGIAQTDSQLGQLFAGIGSAGAAVDGAAVDRLDGRAAQRCTTPDYLPVVGPAPRLDAFLQDYAPLRVNARADIPQPGSYWPGLYLNCGHGSRGLSYAPLASELIASQINREFAPLPRSLATALNPARFIIRGLKRKTL